MKLTLLFLATLFAAVAQDATPSMAGKWRIHAAAAGRQSTAECTFTQNGSELGGECNLPAGKAPVKGRIEGKTASWTYHTDSEGGPVTVAYQGRFESSKKISGTLVALEFSVEGEFTAEAVGN